MFTNKSQFRGHGAPLGLSQHGMRFSAKIPIWLVPRASAHQLRSSKKGFHVVWPFNRPPCLMVKPTNFGTIPHFGDVSTAKNHLKAQEMLQKTLVFQGNIPIFHGNIRVKSSNSDQNQVSASAWTSSPGGGSWLMGCPLGAGGGGLFVSGLSQGFESPQTMLWVGQRQENGRMGDRHHIFSLI